MVLLFLPKGWNKNLAPRRKRVKTEILVFWKLEPMVVDLQAKRLLYITLVI